MPTAAASLTRLVPTAHGLPAPLLSSRGRGWDEFVVELRCACNLDVVLPCPDHAISVILGGAATLCQSRGGRVAQGIVRPGDVIITPAGEPKRWQHVDDIVSVVLRLSRACVDRFAAEIDAYPRERVELTDVFCVRDSFLHETAMYLLRTLEPRFAPPPGHLQGRVRSLCLHLLAKYAGGDSSVHWLPMMPPRKLRRAIEYIEGNLHRDLGVAHIAEHVTMSESHFSHAFRTTVGLPPHRYVRDRRIERAKTLLRQSDMPLNEIARRVGCSSASNFSVLFHRATGTTPRTYRNGG
jgi:AraC family transcriptional regulator